jgi:hypothetical protein
VSADTRRERVLITVMTYPHPSKGYDEVVCTAGIDEQGRWVRLYPIDYRYRPKTQRFHKYQWIRVDLEPRGGRNDPRPESRKPVVDSIELDGEPLSAKHGWAERRAVINALPHHTVHELEAEWDKSRASLGVVRPKRVLDLEVRPADPEWKPEWKQLYEQPRLFGEEVKELRKLPFSFHYVFECEDDPKPRSAMIEDWELGVLFLKESARLGSDEAAAKSVKAKFQDVLCGADKDTRFFMGTRHPFNTWLVLGVFWPPKREATLFD